MNAIIQKSPRILLPKWLRAAEGEPCTLCGRNDGSTVAAHSNRSIHGKGMARKADDLFIAYLCSICHYAHDQGKILSKDAKDLNFDIAMAKTYRRLHEKGLIR